MKNTLRTALLTVAALATLGMPTLSAQGRPLHEDTAARIVDRYDAMLGIDRLPADSTLELTTIVTVVGSTDTFIMRRWFAQPQMLRLEVWHHGDLETGMCTNGSSRYRRYNHSLGYWVDLQPLKFHEQYMSYDFRGPLHNWRASAAQLTYKGKVRVADKGDAMLDAVRVETPGMFTRTYLFDQSGLLTVVFEENEMLDGDLYGWLEEARIDWKCIHEYMPVGSSMLPRLESFKRGGALTVLETTARLVPRDNLLFNSDNPKR